MPSVHDLFTFYLRPENLQGRTALVAIESCAIEEIFNPRARRNEPKLIIRFHGKRLAFAPNKTQAAQIMEITQTDDYTRWKGHMIALSPATAPNGKPTIAISAPPKKQPEPAPPPQEEAATPHTAAPNEAG